MAKQVYPITVSSFKSSVLFGAVATCTGRRRTNEDEHDVRVLENGGLFGIYDGHGGANASRFLKDNLLNRVTQMGQSKHKAKAICSVFLALDKKLQALSKY